MPASNRARDGRCPGVRVSPRTSPASRPPLAAEPPPTQPVCRHCRGPLGLSSRRGLCYACRRNPKIRKRYPRLAPANGARSPWSAWAGAEALPLPGRATDAAPGSAGKVATLAARAAARVQLFHPDDDGEPRPAGPALLAAIAERTAGAYRVQKKTTRWRAYPIDPTARVCRGRRRPRAHLGYFATREEAVAEIIAWLAADCPAGWLARRRTQREREKRWVAHAVKVLGG